MNEDLYNIAMVALVICVPAVSFGIWQHSVAAGIFAFSVILLWNYK